MASLLTRYWFGQEPGYGVGVTAYSLDDAIALITSEPSIIAVDFDSVIEDIDIETLD